MWAMSVSTAQTPELPPATPASTPATTQAPQIPQTPKRSHWSPAQREAARLRAMTSKPWQRSTGPRSERGKVISAHNSYKHGYYSREMRELRALLRLMAHRLAVLDELRRTRKFLEKNFSRNELSSRHFKSAICATNLSVRPDFTENSCLKSITVLHIQKIMECVSMSGTSAGISSSFQFKCFDPSASYIDRQWEQYRSTLHQIALTELSSIQVPLGEDVVKTRIAEWHAHFYKEHDGKVGPCLSAAQDRLRQVIAQPQKLSPLYA